MIFNRHSNLNGLHAPFSPSQPAWLRYDEEKAQQVYLKKQAAKRGTRLHAWAKETIDLGIKQPRSNKTLYAYINDAIGFKMKTEVVLYYSDYFFGTADTISFRKNVLRIHDLKTGEHPASMEQLLVYTALFCLEYRTKPGDLTDIELRLYQNDEVIVHHPTVDEIIPIMDKIIHLNKMLEKLNYEEV
jgi:hypothetical protein